MSSQWSGVAVLVFEREREEAVVEFNRSINLNLLKIFIKVEREGTKKPIQVLRLQLFQGGLVTGGERDLHSDPVSPRLLTNHR